MAAVNYRSSTQASSGGGTTVSFSKPSGLAVGDAMVAHIFFFAATGVTPPSGWTAVYTDGANNGVYAKLADAGDVAASSFVFTLSNSASAAGGMSAYSGADATLFLNQINAATITGTFTALSTSGITPSVGASTILLLTGHRTPLGATVSAYAVATTNPSWTEAYDTNVVIGSDNLGVSLAYAQRGILTATGNATATLSSAASIGSIIVFNLVPPSIPTASSVSAGITPTILIVLAAAASAIAAAIVPTVTSVANKWSNAIKHTGTWFDQTKH